MDNDGKGPTRVIILPVRRHRKLLRQEKDYVICTTFLLHVGEKAVLDNDPRPFGIIDATLGMARERFGIQIRGEREEITARGEEEFGGKRQIIVMHHPFESLQI